MQRGTLDRNAEINLGAIRIEYVLCAVVFTAIMRSLLFGHPAASDHHLCRSLVPPSARASFERYNSLKNHQRDEFVLLLLPLLLFARGRLRRGIEGLLQGVSFLRMFGKDVARDAGPGPGLHWQVMRPSRREYLAGALR